MPTGVYRRDVIVHGYHGCMAVACQNGRRRTIPLALRLWSSNAPGHRGENDEVLQTVALIMADTGGKGTIAYDRGATGPPSTGPSSTIRGISSST